MIHESGWIDPKQKARYPVKWIGAQERYTKTRIKQSEKVVFLRNKQTVGIQGSKRSASK